MAKKLSFAEQLLKEEEYVAFLKKRLDSVNYKTNVSAEEYAKTKDKYDRAKFKLKTLKMKK